MPICCARNVNLDGAAWNSWSSSTSTSRTELRSEVEERESSQAAAAAKLADERHLIPIWKPPVAPGEAKAAHGHRRIVSLTDGTFTGTGIRGTLVPGASADWQTVLTDGTALGDVRYRFACI
jgi:uncharacterized protein DUF3237